MKSENTCINIHFPNISVFVLPHISLSEFQPCPTSQTSSCTREALITVPPAFRSAPATRLLDRSKITHQSERLFNTACPDKVAPLSHEIKSEWEKVEEPFHSLRVHWHHYHHWDCMHVTCTGVPIQTSYLHYAKGWSEQSCLENSIFQLWWYLLKFFFFSS